VRVRVDEHTIQLAGSPVFYRTADPPANGSMQRSASGPTTLYLHGVPTSSDDWIPFLERTGGVAPDLIGFGRSGKAGHLDYTITGLADFVDNFVENLGIERVRLVAHDWGAAAALVFAERQPQRVARLVLCDALPLLEGFRWHRLARICRVPGLGELAMGSTSRWMLARILRRGTTRPDAWSVGQLTAVWDHFDQGTQRAALRLYRSADEPDLVKAGAGLGSLTMPALVIWGEDDPWLSADLADAYAATLPHATVERVTGAGHWPWLDRPEVVERVATFLGQ
jgi:pimeloyl-ACP methyl ester carboxylesterase